MNSNVCHRCRIMPAELSCKECQTSLCPKCDSFVHSSLKRSHKREKIKNFSVSEQNTNYETNINFYNNNSPSNFDNNDIIEENDENNLNFNKLNMDNNPLKNHNSKYQNKSNNISRISQDKFLGTYNSGFNINSNDNPNINLTYNLDYKNRRKFFDENYNIDNIGNIKDIKLSNINSRRNSKKNNYLDNIQIPNLSSTYVGQIKEIYEQERKGLIIKINKLTQDLDITKKNLSERISYLHKHLYEIENKYKLDLREQSDKNLIESKKLEEEKNIKISKLQNIISDQNNIINELQSKIKNLESTISDKENTFLK